MVPAIFSKAKGEQEVGAHQPPTPENMPAGFCPSDSHFKFMSFIHLKAECFTKGYFWAEF